MSREDQAATKIQAIFRAYSVREFWRICEILLSLHGRDSTEHSALSAKVFAVKIREFWRISEILFSLHGRDFSLSGKELAVKNIRKLMMRTSDSSESDAAECDCENCFDDDESSESE